MTFCSSSKVAVFSLLTIDVDLCLNMSEDLNQIYCRRSLDMNANKESRELKRTNFIGIRKGKIGKLVEKGRCE